MPTGAELKAQINAGITSMTADDSITLGNQIGLPMEDIVDYVDQESLGYKVYTALVSQSGTDAPTVKVLKNTLGITMSFSRSGAGNYSAQGSSNVFTTDKTAMLSNYNSNGAYSEGTMHFYSLGAQFFTIESRDAGIASDGLLVDSFIEIRVYP